MYCPIKIAVSVLGSQSGLARVLGVKPQAVQQWVVHDRVPAKRCIAIEQATGGEVSRYELRPDVFGPPPVSRDVA